MASASPSPERGLPRAARWLLALFAAVLAFGASGSPGGWTDGAQLAAIESLAERGTLVIDGAPCADTAERVVYDGHSFSARPASFALIGAAPRWLLGRIGGATGEAHWLYRALVLLLVALPTWLGAAALARLLQRSALGEAWQALLLAIALFASPWLPWSLVLAPSAAAGGLALLALERAARARWISAGLCVGLATAIEPCAGAWLLGIAIFALLSGGARSLARLALASLPPIALQAGLDLAISGRPWPVAWNAEAWQWPLSMRPLLAAEQALRAPGPLSDLLGLELLAPTSPWRQFPVLLACALCLPAALSTCLADRTRVAALLALALAAVLGLGPALAPGRADLDEPFVDGAWAVFAPAWVLVPAAWFGSTGLAARGWPWALALALGALSLLSAGLGALAPWRRFELAPGPQPALGERLALAWSAQRRHARAWGGSTYAIAYEARLRRLAERTLARPAGAERTRALRELELRLRALADPLDRERAPLESRAELHYWIGEIELDRGERVAAQRDYELALVAYTRHIGSRRRLAELRAPQSAPAPDSPASAPSAPSSDG